MNRNIFLSMLIVLINTIYFSNVMSSRNQNENEKKIGKELTQYLKTTDLSKIVMEYSKSDYYFLYRNIEGMAPEISKYLEDGTLDTYFGKSGTIDCSCKKIDSIAVQPDFKVLTIGLNAPPRSIFETYIARFKQNGKLDESFGKNGYITNVPSSDSKITLQNNKKILVSIMQGNSLHIYRYEEDGNLDKLFAQGMGNINLPNFNILDLQTLNDGRFVILGNPVFYNQTAIYRYLENGTIDKSFGKDGVINDLQASWANAMKLQSDNKLIVLRDRNIFRYLENGQLDSNFVNDKIAFDNPLNAAALNITRDGKILIAGSYTENFNDFLKIIRLMPDGLMDNSFGKIEGSTSIGIAGNGSRLFITIDQHENIIVGGNLYSGFDQIGNLLVRFKPNGKLDENFNNLGLS